MLRYLEREAHPGRHAARWRRAVRAGNKEGKGLVPDSLVAVWGGDPRLRSRAGREHQDEDEDEVEDVDEDDDLGQMSVLWSLQRRHEDPRPDVRAS